MDKDRLMQIEEQMGLVTAKMAECQRVIRQAEDAQRELVRLRSKLDDLTMEYAQARQIGNRITAPKPQEPRW